MKDLHIISADGLELAADLYEPETGLDAIRATVVVASALGVPRRFYRHFAHWLSPRGYRVLCFDYRGVGGSRVEDSNVKEASMSDWGQLDLQAAIEHCKQWSQPIALVGHSAGGQLAGLAPNIWDISGLACIAASAPNLRQYSLVGKLKVGFAWYVAAPLIGRLGSRFPARKLGLSSVDLPSGVMREWARWGRASQYLFSKKFGFDLRRYHALHIPLVSFSFTDDDLASRAAIAALLPHYSNCTLTDHYLTPAECGMTRVGHMGFFHPKAELKLWPMFEHWLTESVLKG